MTPQDAFYTLFRDLPREGPGQAEDVDWALYAAATPEAARICDVACGSGADTRTLARARPLAHIEAVDKMAHFIDSARARCAEMRADITFTTGDMAEISGPYDLIWCAGALYFLGVTEGLNLWRPTLAPGGRVAFSEPCLVGKPSAAADSFWQQYPAITDSAGIRARVAAAGYHVLGERMVIGAAWEAYYTPLRKRIACLRPDAGPILTAVLDETEAEIDIWTSAPGDIAYALMVVEPI